MREDSLFNLLGRWAFRTIAFLAALVAFVTLSELLRTFRLLHAVNAALGYTFGAVVVAALGVAGFKAYGFIADRRTLAAPPEPDPEEPTFEALKEYCAYMVHLCKRLGDNPHLDDETRKHVRQEAYDIEEMMGHHPLADDFSRAIAKARQTLRPVIDRLRERANRHTRERMRFVVEDVVDPPFPVIHTMAVLFHQLAMISDVVQTYLSRPALFEHLVVLRDVRNVTVEGRFLSLGQKLFEGIYANATPLGRAIDDIGPVLMSLWLTRTNALIAMMRCESQVEWDGPETIGRVEAMTDDTIAVIKQSLTEDVLPILKVRLRHTAEGGTDAAEASRAIIDGIIKALDTLASNLKHRPEGKPALLTRRLTLHDEPPVSEEEATREENASKRHHRRRPRGIFRVLRTFGQRVKYTTGRGRSWS